MIAKHTQFIEAIHAKKKVWLRFYSQPDSGVLDRVCAPMDYGPEGENKDGLNRYWLWDYAENIGPHMLQLLPQQILDLQVIGDVFDPAELGVRPPQWSIPRDWTGQPSSLEVSTAAPGSLPSPPKPLVGQAQGSKTEPAKEK